VATSAPWTGHTEKGKQMRLLVGLAALFTMVTGYGCAHPIVLTPDLVTLDRTTVTPISKNVGYYVSPAERAKEVTTAGGGGDKVRYFPYKDLEPALQKVLSNLFERVYSMPTGNDAAFIADKHIRFVFVPEIDTKSSSSSAFTWPPTSFTIYLNCAAMDPSGKTLWQKRIEATGEAEFSEFKADVSLSAKRAAQKAFGELQQELNGAPEFRQ
jgi:hypothetical protein